MPAAGFIEIVLEICRILAGFAFSKFLAQGSIEQEQFLVLFCIDGEGEGREGEKERQTNRGR